MRHAWLTVDSPPSLLRCRIGRSELATQSRPTASCASRWRSSRWDPTGHRRAPTRWRTGGIQKILADLGATVRVETGAADRRSKTPNTAAGRSWALSLGHFADIVTKNERDGYFTVGLLATCPSMPGLVAGLQRSGIDDRAASRRHAVARRASRLQHARDDPQRIARRHAGRRRDRPRAARDAARREARSADVGSEHRDGRRAA